MLNCERTARLWSERVKKVKYQWYKEEVSGRGGGEVVGVGGVQALEVQQRQHQRARRHARAARQPRRRVRVQPPQRAPALRDRPQRARDLYKQTQTYRKKPTIFIFMWTLTTSASNEPKQFFLTISFRAAPNSKETSFNLFDADATLYLHQTNWKKFHLLTVIITHTNTREGTVFNFE